MLLGCEHSLARKNRLLWVFTFAIALLPCSPVWALILGGEGNDPIPDPGWPKHAEAVFNTKSRVAYWEGPPFGGGQYHAECRGDTAAFQPILDDFAKIETPLKRIVLRDGVGQSFWLNSNRDKDKLKSAQIDWVFMVWQPDRRNRQRRLPVGLSAIGKTDPAVVAELEVFTGGEITWANVKIPAEIEILDQRLEAHGFSENDGTVLEGKVIDLATRLPLKSTLQLQKVEPKPQGGYLYSELAEVATDADGHWVLKNVPQEWCRLVLTAEGYASRVIGYGKYDDQPRWSEHNSGLSKSGTVKGRVVDRQGQPLADVSVRIGDFDVKDTGRYEILEGSDIKSDADGRFSVESLPRGAATVWVHKPGYVRPGLGQKIPIPAKAVVVEMDSSAKLRVTVDFTAAKRAGDYLVHIVPEGGEVVGKWSGSASLNDKQVVTFEDIPSGRYVVSGRPNPSTPDQQTDPKTVELSAGEQAEISIKAK